MPCHRLPDYSLFVPACKGLKTGYLGCPFQLFDAPVRRSCHGPACQQPGLLSFGANKINLAQLHQAASTGLPRYRVSFWAFPYVAQLKPSEPSGADPKSVSNGQISPDARRCYIKVQEPPFNTAWKSRRKYHRNHQAQQESFNLGRLPPRPNTISKSIQANNLRISGTRPHRLYNLVVPKKYFAVQTLQTSTFRPLKSFSQQNIKMPAHRPSQLPPCPGPPPSRPLPPLPK